MALVESCLSGLMGIGGKREQVISISLQTCSPVSLQECCEHLAASCLRYVCKSIVNIWLAQLVQSAEQAAWTFMCYNLQRAWEDTAAACFFLQSGSSQWIQRSSQTTPRRPRALHYSSSTNIRIIGWETGAVRLNLVAAAATQTAKPTVWSPTETGRDSQPARRRCSPVQSSRFIMPYFSLRKFLLPIFLYKCLYFVMMASFSTMGNMCQDKIPIRHDTKCISWPCLKMNCHALN
jgi:hypothetical protein